MITRIVLAVIVAVAIGLILSALLGPVLVSLHAPVAETVGRFFTDWGWIIGALIGLWYFFGGGSFNFPRRQP